MKKVLALFLAVLMVMSCMVFTVSAEAAPAPEFLPVSDADTIDGWKRGNPDATYSILTDGDQKQGEGAFAITLAGRQASNKVAAFEFAYSLAQPMDVSDMKTLVFDFYVEDADAIRMLRWDFMLYDAEHGAYADSYRHFLKGKTMDEIAGAPIVDGWNRVEVDLAAMAKGYNGFSDLTKFTMIRFYSNENNGAGTQVEHGAFEGTLTLAIDNVYFKKADRATPSFSIPILAFGANNQSHDTISTAHNNNTATPAGDNPTEGFRASTKMWSGGGFTTNLLNYNALEFDLYIDNAFANKVHYTLNFGTVTDFYQANIYMYSKTLEELAGYELKPGWNHVKIDLARFDAQRYENNTKIIDLTNANFFSMYNDTSKAVGTVDTSDTQVTLNMANVMLTNNGSEFFTVSNFHAIRSGENYGYPSHTQTPNGWPNASLKHADIDGDGDTEWELLNTTGAGTTAFYSSQNTGMKTAGYALNLHSATTDFSDVTAISFDVYCAFGAADANLDPTDVTFSLRLNNNTNFDWNNRDSYHGLTVDLKEAEYLGNNWYRVKAPLSQWVKNTGVAASADKLGGGTPDLNDVNILRVLGMNSISYTDGFKFALDNLRFWTEEIVEETPVDNTRLLADFSGDGVLGAFQDFSSWRTAGFKSAGTWSHTGGIESGVARLQWQSVARTIDASNYPAETIVGPTNSKWDANKVISGKQFRVADYADWMRDDTVEAIQFDIELKALSGMTNAAGTAASVADLYFKIGLATDYRDNWTLQYSAPFRVGDQESLGNNWYRVTIPLSSFTDIVNSNDYDIANLWAFQVNGNVAENYGVNIGANFGMRVDNLSVVLKDNWQEIITDIDLMGLGHESWYHNNATYSINHVTDTMNLNGDIDGDGNNEIIITNQTGAYENAPLEELFGLTNWNYHYNYEMKEGTDAVQFRMLYAADGQALTDKNFAIWFVSVYKDYDYGATMKLTFTLDQYGERMGDTNWYLVTIPFSAFTVKNTTYNSSADRYVAGHAPNLNALGQLYVSAPAVSYENSYQVALADFQLTTMPVVEEPDSYIDFTGANLVLTNSFNFKFNANAVGANGLFATVDFNGQTTKVAPTLDGTTGKYEVNVNGIYAHQLAKGVTVTMWGLSSDGVMLKDAKVNYSVKENLTNLIKNENSKYQLKDQTIAADALAYGQAALTFSGWAVDEQIVDETNRELVEAYASSTEGVPASALTTLNGTYTSGATWLGAKLVLDNTVLVRFIFEADNTDGLSVNVEGVAEATTVTEFVSTEDGRFYFDVPVYASEFGNTIKVSFNGDAEYFVNYSVNHYLAKKYTAEPAEDYVNFNNLLVAMYRYGVTAAAY